jgi:predicted metal-dependent hydrolase
MRCFNAGDYWESHEVVEAVWRTSRSRFYHGLILYASAWVHVRRGNAAGVRAQAGKALAELSPYLPGYLGLDVEAIVRDLHRLAGTGIDAERVEMTSPLTGMIPPLLELQPGRVRGDEPELWQSD